MIVHRRYGATVFEIPARGSVVQVKRRGIWGLVDAFGDVTIHHGGTTYQVEGLQTATSLQSWVKKRN